MRGLSKGALRLARRAGWKGSGIPAIAGGAQVEYVYPDDKLTFTANAAIDASTYAPVVELVGNRLVAAAGAASVKVVGVAVTDTTAAGQPVTVATDGVWPCKAAGAINAGDLVASGAAGTVAAIGAGTFGTRVGIALEAIADTAVGRVMIQL